jgi:hypothetical protein
VNVKVFEILWGGVLWRLTLLCKHFILQIIIEEGSKWFLFWWCFCSLITGFLSSLALLLLSQWSTPPLRFQVSACSTFLMMCDVPSMAVFCRESIECCPGIVSSIFYFTYNPVATVITGMTKHFMFHIRLISILRFLYFHFFSASFCITFLLLLSSGNVVKFKYLGTIWLPWWLRQYAPLKRRFISTRLHGAVS